MREFITNIEQRRVVPTKETKAADSYTSLSNLTITIYVLYQLLSLSYLHIVITLTFLFANCNNSHFPICIL